MRKARLNPTLNQTFELEGFGEFDFTTIASRCLRLENGGDIGAACELRYAAVQRIVELLPEDEDINLEWSHTNSRMAMEIVSRSAVDHFLCGDFEMAAAIGEQLLELDPEDHLDTSGFLAFCYVALEDYDSFDDILLDIPDDKAPGALLRLAASFRRRGTLSPEEAAAFRSRFPVFYEEFCREEHPVEEWYTAELASSDPPSQRFAARQLWLQTEALWKICPGFAKALRCE